MNKPKIVFMGSPEFALPILKSLAENYPVVGVVTQPDRPAGRGQEVSPPPVKLLAMKLGIPFIQPQRLRQPEAMEQLRAWNPDLIVVAAFGQILRPEVLNLPPRGCINVHASLLPRWRGAAPIQAAILHGDKETGITIMLMDAGVDTGPILSQRPMLIRPDDTAGTLSQRLAIQGAELLLETIPRYLSGEATLRTQDESLATYAPMLKKEAGLLQFDQPAIELMRKVHAFNPWPGAYMYWQGNILKVHRASARSFAELKTRDIAPGELVIFQKQPAVGTTDGVLILEEVQPAGKKAMPGKAFLHGVRSWGKHV